jgi:hypothetical protein
VDAARGNDEVRQFVTGATRRKEPPELVVAVLALAGLVDERLQDATVGEHNRKVARRRSASLKDDVGLVPVGAPALDEVVPPVPRRVLLDEVPVPDR